MPSIVFDIITSVLKNLRIMTRGGENDKWQTPPTPAIIESPSRSQRNIESPETVTQITSSVEPQDADDSCTTACSTPRKPESTKKANMPGIPRIIRRSLIRRTRMNHIFWMYRNRSTHKHSSTYNAPTRTTPTTPSTTEHPNTPAKIDENHSDSAPPVEENIPTSVGSIRLTCVFRRLVQFM